MHESAFSIHEIELVIDTTECLSDGSGVCNHAHSTLHTGKIPSGNDSGRLVVDTAFETSGAPVDKLNGPLRLDGSNSRVDILGHNISTVHEATCHILSVARIALGHHAGRLEDGVGDLGDGKLFVVGFFGGDDGGVGGEHEVDAGVGHEVGLELGHVHVKGTVETEGGREGGGDLGDESVEVGVGGTLDVEVAFADFVEGLVVKAEGTVRVFQKGMGGQYGVVRLNHSSGHLGRGGHRKRKLGLATIVHREALEEQSPESRSGSSPRGMEDEETLKAGAVIRQLADPIENEVDNFLPNGVMPTRVIVRRILLPTNNLLGMVQLPVSTRPHLITHRRFQINIHRTRHMLPRARLRKEGAKSVIRLSVAAGHHLAIGLDAVLEAVEFPAAVSGLDAGLAHVDGNTFAHDDGCLEGWEEEGNGGFFVNANLS
mmetsp:Transcript_35174/g.57350  ORF Transcript_35174/g.57350 Transcript_35174/m.57350 type:complete len:429 (-) Transcript_35174:15-1301(-)